MKREPRKFAPSGLHQSEIAIVLGGITPQGVSSLLHNAKRKLSSRMVNLGSHRLTAWEYLGKLLIQRQRLLDRCPQIAADDHQRFSAYMNKISAKNATREPYHKCQK